MLLACGQAADAHEVSVDGHRLAVELADSPAEREQGLMFRDSLPRDGGMLFVYPDVRERGFWMKNTPLPLSIAFVDERGVIVHIAEMKPMDTSLTPSAKPAAYALEVNRGWFAEHGVTVGDRVTGLPPAAKE